MLKTGFVYIKMDIALFKIGSTGLPNLGFGVQSIDRKIGGTNAEMPEPPPPKVSDEPPPRKRHRNGF